MDIAYDVNTLAILGKNGAICSTCCFTPQYSSGDCCCFLDPSPSAYNGSRTYGLYEAVSYNGFNWYSLQNDNNSLPIEGGGWWAKYTDCGNSGWNSCPPFGGVGKTPLKYIFTQSIMSYISGGNYYYYPEHITILERYDSCAWTGSSTFQYYSSQDNLWIPVTQGATLLLNTFCEDATGAFLFNFGLSAWGLPMKSCDYADYALIGNPCDIRGSKSLSQINGSWRKFSWKPYDCAYSTWDLTANYSVDACVTWNGKFYKACKRSGPNYGGAQEPSDSELDYCTGSNYWREV